MFKIIWLLCLISTIVNGEMQKEVANTNSATDINSDRDFSKNSDDVLEALNDGKHSTLSKNISPKFL